MAKGIFTPDNPEKYLGDINRIAFRSSWELRFFQFCDTNPNVLKWASEEIKIPYIKPTTGKVHHYYPDVFLIYRNKNGEEIRELIEIKPEKETRLTKKSTLYDKVAIVINEAKWKAANDFCNKQGIRFRVVTEKSLFRT